MIRTRRSKPRPGRLKGKAKRELREDVFDRDGYCCQHVIEVSLGMYGEPQEKRCMKRVTWDSGHMAHIVGRGRGGPDTLENCVTKCAHCHLVLEHMQGGKGKIVPAKGQA